MNISWYYGLSSGNENILLGSDTNIINSTQNELLFAATERSTPYYWKIVVDDGTHYQNETFVFQTEGYGAGYSYQPTANSLWVIGILGMVGFVFVLFFLNKKRKNNYGDDF